MQARETTETVLKDTVVGGIARVRAVQQRDVPCLEDLEICEGRARSSARALGIELWLDELV